MGAALQECAFGVSVQISNFSLEFCAKRNNFPDLDKLFALLFLAKDDEAERGGFRLAGSCCSGRGLTSTVSSVVNLDCFVSLTCTVS